MDYLKRNGITGIKLQILINRFQTVVYGYSFLSIDLTMTPKKPLHLKPTGALSPPPPP